MAKRYPCVDCNKLTSAADFWDSDIPRCPTCRKKIESITATRARSEYHVSDALLNCLPCNERPNPHYSRGAPMRLYRKSDVIAASSGGVLSTAVEFDRSDPPRFAIISSRECGRWADNLGRDVERLPVESVAAEHRYYSFDNVFLCAYVTMLDNYDDALMLKDTDGDEYADTIPFVRATIASGPYRLNGCGDDVFYRVRSPYLSDDVIDLVSVCYLAPHATTEFIRKCGIDRTAR